MHFGDGFFMTGLLWTDLVRVSLVGGRRLESVLNGIRKQIRRTCGWPDVAFQSGRLLDGGRRDNRDGGILGIGFFDGLLRTDLVGLSLVGGS